MKVLPRIRLTIALLGVLIAGLLPWAKPACAQETTGNVSGVVQDTTGALVPQASVLLTDLDNKTQRKAVSNGSGEFAIVSVTSGLRYQVKVVMAGFKPWESKVFPLRPGDRINFTDIKLAAGETTEQVTVEATESQAVKPLDTPERSDVITSKDLETLAIVGRDAEELIETLPGVALISPGVNNQSTANTTAVGLNNNISGGFSVNGMGPTGLATILDGVSLTDIQTNSGTVQTINSDMVQEVKVSTSNFSAANAKGPAIFNATTKAGGSAYHGGGYLYARDGALNANDWYNNYLQQTRPDARYLYPGGQIGGPLWIPGTRFTRRNDKLFFFYGLEFYNQKYSPETLGSWVPTYAERAGDFSLTNLNAQLCGARPDGGLNPNSSQAMCYAESYLSDGTPVVNGNVTSFANAGGVALVNWLPLPNANPFTNISGFNYIQPVEQTQNGNMMHARLDYSINDNNKLALTYGRQSEIDDEPVSLGYAPNYSVLYPGNVTEGSISNIFSVTYTRVFTPTLTNYFNAALSLISNPGNLGDPSAVSRFHMNDYDCESPSLRASGTCNNPATDNFNYLGAYKNAGDYSIPALSDGGGNLGYPNVLMPGGFYNNQVHLKKTVPDVEDEVTWVKGAHTLTLGGYFERGMLNGIANNGAFPQGEYTFNPGTSGYEYNSGIPAAPGPFSETNFTSCQNPQSTGTSRTSGAAYLGSCINPIAMMYMGTPDSFTQTNFTPIVNMQYTTLAGFANDQYKFRRVTFMLGARFEHLGPWTDRHNNGLATFSPTLYNSECTRANNVAITCAQSTDYPGVTWHGLNKATSNQVNNPAQVFFSPRVGLAWDIFGHGNTVLRGGWGVYRHEEEFAPYALAAATAQGYKTTQIQNQAFTFNTIDEQAPINPQDFSINVLTAGDTTRPVYYQYNADISQRLSIQKLHLKDTLIEIAYVGNNGQNMSTFNQGSSYNEASDVNLIPQGYMLQNNFNLGVLPTLLSAAGVSELNTSSQDYFRPYPFYQHIYALKHDFYYNYNSAQVSWNKSTGAITYGVNYVFSKELATAASYNNQLVDPLNLRNDYNPATFDRTHTINAHYQVDFGKHYHGDRRVLAGAVNGWLLSGISQFTSGEDLASGQGENFGFGYGSLTPTQVPTNQQLPDAEELQTCQQTYKIPMDANGNQYCTTSLSPITWLGTPDYLLMPTLKCNPKSGLMKNQFINPTCLGIPLPGGSPTSNGQGVPRLPYIHSPSYQNHNLSLYKSFTIREGQLLQLHASGFNFLNHPLVSFNNNDSTNLSLGTLNYAVAGQALTPSMLRVQNFGTADIKFGARIIELGAKYTF